MIDNLKTTVHRFRYILNLSINYNKFRKWVGITMQINRLSLDEELSSFKISR